MLPEKDVGWRHPTVPSSALPPAPNVSQLLMPADNGIAGTAMTRVFFRTGVALQHSSPEMANLRKGIDY